MLPVLIDYTTENQNAPCFDQYVVDFVHSAQIHVYFRPAVILNQVLLTDNLFVSAFAAIQIVPLAIVLPANEPLLDFPSTSKFGVVTHHDRICGSDDEI